MPAFQTVRDSEYNRAWHVWRRLDKGRWKCLLCGGLSRKPSYNDVPELGYSLPLTTEERHAAAPK